MNVTLERAHPSDTAELTRIAKAAKRHWGYPDEWMKRWDDDLTVTRATLNEFDVTTAEADGKVVGFCALAERDEAVDELESLWVHPNAMGNGVGKRLLRHVVETVRERGGRRLDVVSDPNAVGFYERHGARRVGNVETEVEGRTLPKLTIVVK